MWRWLTRLAVGSSTLSVGAPFYAATTSERRLRFRASGDRYLQSATFRCEYVVSFIDHLIIVLLFLLCHPREGLVVKSSLFPESVLTLHHEILLLGRGLTSKQLDLAVIIGDRGCRLR